MIFVLTSGSYSDYGIICIMEGPDSGITLSMYEAALAEKLPLSDWLEQQPGWKRLEYREQNEDDLNTEWFDAHVLLGLKDNAVMVQYCPTPSGKWFARDYRRTRPEWCRVPPPELPGVPSEAEARRVLLEMGCVVVQGKQKKEFVSPFDLR